MKIDPAHSFFGSRLKVERAHFHIQELEHRLAEFLKTDFYRLRIEFDADEGHDVLRLDSVLPLPNAMPLVIGDVLHNLRAALDYITSQVVGQDNHRITFPMGRERENVLRSDSFGLVRKAAPKVADFIIDSIRPYEGGNYPLWALGRLDNFDKHKLLVPILSVQAVQDVCGESDDGMVFRGCTLGIVGSGFVEAISTPAKLRITSFGAPVANMLFPEGQCFAGQPVTPVLRQLTKIAVEVIHSLEAVHFGQQEGDGTTT